MNIKEKIMSNTTVIDKLVEENIKLRKRMWEGVNGLCSSDYPKVSRKTRKSPIGKLSGDVSEREHKNSSEKLYSNE